MNSAPHITTPSLSLPLPPPFPLWHPHKYKHKNRNMHADKNRKMLKSPSGLFINRTIITCLYTANKLDQNKLWWITNMHPLPHPHPPLTIIHLKHARTNPRLVPFKISAQTHHNRKLRMTDSACHTCNTYPRRTGVVGGRWRLFYKLRLVTCCNCEWPIRPAIHQTLERESWGKDDSFLQAAPRDLQKLRVTDSACHTSNTRARIVGGRWQLFTSCVSWLAVIASDRFGVPYIKHESESRGGKDNSFLQAASRDLQKLRVTDSAFHTSDTRAWVAGVKITAFYKLRLVTFRSMLEPDKVEDFSEQISAKAGQGRRLFGADPCKSRTR